MASCYMVVSLKINSSAMNRIIAISNLMSLILVLVGGIIIIRGEEKG